MSRLDKLMVLRGMVPSRARAVALIEQGGVMVHGEVVSHAARMVEEDAVILLVQEDIPWVSRAGIKLAAALDAWGIHAEGKTCMDVGASTGGFTQVLLSHGAKLIFAIDVGTNQLSPILRDDPRVVSMEQTHILEIAPSAIPRADLIVVDLSFISLIKVLQHILHFLKPGGEMVLLVKPQFEVGKEITDQTKGVVRDASFHDDVLRRVQAHLTTLGCMVVAVMDSPIEGGDGNKEFLMHVRR